MIIKSFEIGNIKFSDMRALRILFVISVILEFIIGLSVALKNNSYSRFSAPLVIKCVRDRQSAFEYKTKIVLETIS